MKSVIIIAIAIVLLIPISVYAEDIEIELSVGQWVKYTFSIQVGGDDAMIKDMEGVKRLMADQISEISGYDIDSAIWVKYTVADISGSVVTFDRSVKLAANSEIRDEFMHQTFLQIISPENKIDAEILENIYEKKLESKPFDLAEFDPVTFYAMPTNLEFGSKFDGGSTYGEITFSSISDTFETGTKNNHFTAHKIILQKFREGVEVITVEVDTLFDVYYDKQSGLLRTRSIDTEFTKLNSRDSGWITHEISILERSDDLKSTSVIQPINNRNEILESLSYLFVESADSEFLFTNEIESIGEPKRTTFDIIRVSDGYELGSLILYGDDEISLIRSSTLVGGAVKLFESDRVHGLIVLSLEPSCEIFVPDHVDLLLDNTDEGSAFVETACNDINVSRSWTETDAGLKMGVFVQEITFLGESTVGQNDVTKQIQDISSTEQSSEDISTNDEGGGCLIATATYGSELAPQVQQLRELRDNQLLTTKSGTSFMNTFNDVYYSFSPIIADYERENPIFKEMVKIAITPMITSLSILNYVDMDTEVEVLGIGISLILFNIGMYVGIPAIVIMRIRKK